MINKQHIGLGLVCGKKRIENKIRFNLELQHAHKLIATTQRTCGPYVLQPEANKHELITTLNATFTSIYTGVS